MNKKNFLVLTLAGTMLMPTNIFASEYKDVHKNSSVSWAYEYINVLSNKNILNGYEDGTFRPNKPVSFLETMQIIKSLINPSSDVMSKARDMYKDVTNKENVPSWAVDAICFNLYNETITNKTLNEANRRGFLNNKVFPSRNSVAIYIARALKLSNTVDKSLLKYNDIEKINKSTIDYLPELVNQGIFTATGSDGNFNGEKYIRRSEMAAISFKTLKYLEKYPYTIVNETSDNTEDLNIVDDIISNKDYLNNAEINKNKNENTNKNMNEFFNFSGNIIEIIDAGNIKYIKLKVDYSENENLKIDDIISVTSKRHYNIGDTIKCEANYIDGAIRNIKIK